MSEIELNSMIDRAASTLVKKLAPYLITIILGGIGSMVFFVFTTKASLSQNERDHERFKTDIERKADKEYVQLIREDIRAFTLRAKE
jgi:hypothetical protein